MNERRISVRRPPRRHRALAWVGVVGMILALLSAGVTTSALAQPASGLEGLGELDTGDVVLGGKTSKVLTVDADARRLYMAIKQLGEQYRIAEYDLSKDIPTLVRMTEPFLNSNLRASESTVAVDAATNRLILLTEVPPANIPTIVIIDLDTLTEVDAFDVPEKAPGFRPAGLAYNPDNDRIYLVGKWEGNSNATAPFLISGTTSPTSAIVALDGTSGSLVWANALTQCDQPMASADGGALAGLSSDRERLYTFCAGRTDASQPTGQSGLVRLDIAGEEDTPALANFPAEFFPVSGAYTDSAATDPGVAGFDSERERVVVQSLSGQTHGAWVFDGRRSSWLGFVAAPDNSNQYLGLDPATGKHYMAGGTTQRSGPGDEFHGLGYINITDASATPIPQGLLFDRITMPPGGDPGRLVPDSHILVDPPTGRVFLPVAADTGERTESGSPVYRYFLAVLRDTTPPITPPGPLELDSFTHDLSDDEARLEFSANTSGFGARYINVGGWENVYTRLAVPFFGIPVSGPAPNPANIRYGNRGATMSLVEQVGIASSGSSATAIPTQPDDNTPADAETKQNQATEPVGGLPSGDGDGGEEDEPEGFSYATCLDGVGEPVSTEEGSADEPAHAVVRCDLDKLETTAHARFSGGSGGAGVAVSDSSFDGRTFRDPDRGIVTETEAIAEGISFGDADVGGFSIDRITSTATTWAKGLDGTSHVRWVRTVEGVRTFDADGTASEPRSCTTSVESGKETVEEGGCESLQKDLNDLIPNRFEVRFPLPEVVATPGGAFASVQESNSDFLSGQATNNDQLRMVPGMEMTVFADGPQRGRLWVQLAAVKADATFIRSPIQTFDPAASAGASDGAAGSSAGGGDVGALSGPPSTGETTAATPEVADDGLILASHEQRLVGAFGWLPALRSFGDAVLTGALYLVFLFPLAEIVRRRRLLGLLADGAHADRPHPSPSRSTVRSTA